MKVIAQAKDGKKMSIECLPTADSSNYVVLVDGGREIYSTNEGFAKFCAQNFSEQRADEILFNIGAIQG